MVYRRKDATGWWFRGVKDPVTSKRPQVRAHATKKRDAAIEQARFRADQLSKVPAEDDLFNFIQQVFAPEQRSNLSYHSKERELGIINEHLVPEFGGPMSAITAEKIICYKNARLEKAKPDTVRKELQVLKHILSLAQRFKRITHNPFADIKLPRAAPGRVRWIQPRDFAKILSKLDERYRLAAVFLINTGCRRSEMLNLCWSDLDLAKGIAIIRKSKTNTVRYVRINEEVKTVIKACMRKVGEERIFWFTTPDGLSWAFRQAVSRAGIKDFRLHDLRHTFASFIKMSGQDIDTIARLLGHADLRMSQRYTHLSPEFLRKATEGIDGMFGQIDSAKPEEERVN